MANRRTFLKNSLIGGLAGAIPVSTLTACVSGSDSDKPQEAGATDAKNGKITFLQTTDVHCQLHQHDELFWENEEIVFRRTGGYAHLSTALKQLKAENPENTLIMDTGDMFQGSMLSVLTEGSAFMPILNAMNYDLYHPGNWEVVYYKEQMQHLLGGLKAPKVCTNMYHDLGEGKRGELIFQPYQIYTRLGIKIGFLGYTDHLVPKRQSPLYSRGIIYTEAKENLKHYVDVLRNQEKCDLVIILSHMGLSQQIALGNHPDCEGVDYIFGADTHERVRKPIQAKYTKIVEPGAFGSFVGKLDIEVVDGKIGAHSYELVEVDPKRFKADPDMLALVEELERPHKEAINTVIGYSKQPLYRYFVVENTIDTMIVDALKWRINVDVVLSNGFRFCPPRIADASGLVPITEGYLYDMLPVEATVRTGKVKGRQLLDWLEKELQNVFAEDASKRFGGWVVRFKGMQVDFKAFADFGERVQKVVIGGEPIDLDREYSICACEREGDPDDVLCRMTGVSDTKNTAYTLHGVVKEYLKEFSPVNPELRNDSQVLDASPTLLSQVSGVDYQFV
jgi:2',3'-cyclic-nucleotide 2'-phosphodiesterase (5'-nucleotidase family)